MTRETKTNAATTAGTDGLEGAMQALEDELAALEHEAGRLRCRIRELEMREGYEREMVAAEGGTKPLLLRLAAIGREKEAKEMALLELRIKRLMRDAEPSRVEQQAARDAQERIREEEKRLKREAAASDRHIKATWSVNAYDDKIRTLWAELRRGEGGKL